MGNGTLREGLSVNKVLFTFVVLLLGSLWAIAWGSIQANGNRVNELEKVVPVVQEQYKGIVSRLQRIEDKLDNGR